MILLNLLATIVIVVVGGLMAAILYDLYTTIRELGAVDRARRSDPSKQDAKGSSDAG